MKYAPLPFFLELITNLAVFKQLKLNNQPTQPGVSFDLARNNLLMRLKFRRL